MDIVQVLVKLISSSYIVISLSIIGPPFKENKLKYVVNFLFLAIYMYVLTLMLPLYNHSKIEPYLSTFGIIILHLIIFRSKLFDTLFFFLIGYIIIIISEISILTIFTIFDYDIQIVINNNIVLIIFQLILMITIFTISRFNFLRKLYIKNKEIAPYLMVLSFSIFIFVQLMRIVTDWMVNDKSTNYIYTILLFLCLILVYIILLRYVIKNQKEQEQVKSYKEYEKLIIPLIDNSRSIEHDFKNHLLTLKSLALSNTPEEYDKYMTSVNNEVSKSSIYKLCKNPVIGALIQEKSNFATDNYIKFDINIYEKDIYEYSVKPYELITVISNLIDNAFEEVLSLSSQDRTVKFEYIEKDNIEITVSNSLSKKVDETIISANHSHFSTKDKTRGYGLKNIKKIIKKYDGDIMLFHNDNTIDIKVVLKT